MQKFAHEYTRQKTAADAARVAGYQDPRGKAAGVRAVELLKRPEVRSMIAADIRALIVEKYLGND